MYDDILYEVFVYWRRIYYIVERNVILQVVQYVDIALYVFSVFFDDRNFRNNLVCALAKNWNTRAKAFTHCYRALLQTPPPPVTACVNRLKR